MTTALLRLNLLHSSQSFVKKAQAVCIQQHSTRLGTNRRPQIYLGFLSSYNLIIAQKASSSSPQFNGVGPL